MAGGRRTAHVPTRTCVACRTSRPKGELVRIVRRPDGDVTIDETGRVGGRGAYLCRDAGCWKIGLEKGAIGRALEVPLPVGMREALLAGPTNMIDNEGGAGGTE